MLLVGDRVGAGACVGAASFAIALTLLVQTNFDPNLTQDNFNPFTTTCVPNFRHIFPGCGVAENTGVVESIEARRAKSTVVITTRLLVLAGVIAASCVFSSQYLGKQG